MGYLWVVLALGSSIAYGLCYALFEEAVRTYSIPFILLVGSITQTVIYTTLLLFSPSGFAKDWSALVSGEKVWLIFAYALAIIAGNILISFAIVSKNATLAATLEITYPLFTALFAYLFFKHTQLNTGAAVGGVLILIGIYLVVKYGQQV